jgi:hypothetical protein
MTIAEKKEEIRDILARYGMYQEFTSDTITNLLMNHHYGYKNQTKYIPKLFRKSPHTLYLYVLETYLEGQGWKGVSWTKACEDFDPLEDVSRLINQQLRTYVEPDMSKARKRNRRKCSFCGNLLNIHQHHETPFKLLVKEFIKDVGEEYLVNFAKQYDYFREEHFCLPPHAALDAFKQKHDSILIVPLCKKCHLARHAEMRKVNQEENF